MKFNNFFTTYTGVKPPEDYIEDYQDLKLYNFMKEPMVTILDTIPAFNIEEFLGVVSPYESTSPEIVLWEWMLEDPSKEDNTKANEVVKLARTFLNKPYIYGASDPDKGFDCSGLIGYVYKLIGILLPRTSHDIAKVGVEVSLPDVLPGDIIYTSSRGPSGGHVKMVSNVSDGQISVIEAKGEKWGIVESVLTDTSNIKSIRRILSNSSNSYSISTDKTNNGKFANRKDFITALVNTYKEVLTEFGKDPNFAYALTASAAHESGWGKHLSGTFNYGGIKGKTGTSTYTIDYIAGKGNVRHKQTFRNFESIKDYCTYVVNMLNKLGRYASAFDRHSANLPLVFWRDILKRGYGGGSESNINLYMNSFNKIYNIVRYGK